MTAPEVVPAGTLQPRGSNGPDESIHLDNLPRRQYNGLDLEALVRDQLTRLGYTDVDSSVVDQFVRDLEASLAAEPILEDTSLDGESSVSPGSQYRSQQVSPAKEHVTVRADYDLSQKTAAFATSPTHDGPEHVSQNMSSGPYRSDSSAHIFVESPDAPHLGNVSHLLDPSLKGKEALYETQSNHGPSIEHTFPATLPHPLVHLEQAQEAKPDTYSWTITRDEVREQLNAIGYTKPITEDVLDEFVRELNESYADHAAHAGEVEHDNELGDTLHEDQQTEYQPQQHGELTEEQSHRDEFYFASDHEAEAVSVDEENCNQKYIDSDDPDADVNLPSKNDLEQQLREIEDEMKRLQMKTYASAPTGANSFREANMLAATTTAQQSIHTFYERPSAFAPDSFVEPFGERETRQHDHSLRDRFTLDPVGNRGYQYGPIGTPTGLAGRKKMTQQQHLSSLYFEDSHDENADPSYYEGDVVDTNSCVTKKKSPGRAAGFIRPRQYCAAPKQTLRRIDPVSRFKEHQLAWSRNRIPTDRKPVSSAESIAGPTIYGGLAVAAASSDSLFSSSGNPRKPIERPRHNLAAKRPLYEVPTTKLRRELCWKIREMTMVQQPEHAPFQRGQHRVGLMSYQVPTDKLRRNLCWQIRSKMMGGER